MKLFLFLILLSGISFCYAQNDSAYHYFNRVRTLTSVENKIFRTEGSEKLLYELIYSLKKVDLALAGKYIDSLEQNNLLNNSKKPLLYFFKAFYYKIKNNDSLTLINYNKAIKKARQINDNETILNSLSGLGQMYDYIGDNHYRLDYLNKHYDIAKKTKNNSHKIINDFLKGNYYYYRNNNNKALHHYRNIFTYNFNKEDSIFIQYTYNSLGALYQENIKKPDSALYYYNKKLEFGRKHPIYRDGNFYFNSYLNLGIVYQVLKQYNTAEVYYLKADSISVKENLLHNTSKIKKKLSELYEQKGDFKKALFFLNKYNIIKDKLKVSQQIKAIAEIQEKYNNAELLIKNTEQEKENLKIEAQNKKTQNLLFGSLSLLLFGTILFYLIQKNTKKKQLLAEQGKTLEKQKVATLLKDQEINSINAMIEGQEKERQRIANDLHDDLGGLMATVKLQFNVLQEQQTPELFNTTNSLLDEAYNKIRSIAHAKNSGVIAKQGLLKAVKNMAHNISSASTIDIEVTDYGLESRLENSLELTIFRIIQELTTNIIKHAEATHAIISLTNHEDSLNIMIEDNGKGFNTNRVVQNNGMGLHSIEKRVEHLEGELKIESQPNQGTTIIIDIPL